MARVVELRYFGGLTVDETARALGISGPTVALDSRMARAWLLARVRGGGAAEADGGEGAERRAAGAPG